MRVQKAENVNKALEFITSRGVKLTNIGPEGWFAVTIFRCLKPTQCLRYNRRKPEAHSRHDLDTYLTFYNRGHQVRTTYSSYLGVIID